MRLLDLFCGAGGAAVGYARAGFEVVGWDRDPQPDYPFEFHHGDWSEADLTGFDAIHASPPCQRFSTATADPDRHPDLIAPVREALIGSGLPYVIENVPQSPLINPVRLCGSAFGLRVRRHRHFESNALIFGTTCRHYQQGTPVGVYGDHPDPRPYLRPDGTQRGTKARTVAEAQEAMGMPWADWRGLAEAIPPAYTEWIGTQLADHIRAERAA